MTTDLATLLDAQTRIDNGCGSDADRRLAGRLDRVLQPAVGRIRDIEHLADLDRWQRWHDEHCDDEETCTHYELREA